MLLFNSLLFKRLATLTAIFCSLLLVQNSCVYTERITSGQMAFERKQYAVAADMLHREYERASLVSERSHLAYLRAQSLEMTGRHEEAGNWYYKAYDHGFGPDALRGYAYSLKMQEKYEEAIEAFTGLGIEIGTPYEYRREIAACRQAAGWNQLIHRSPYSIESAPFNSNASDFSPVFDGDQSILFVSDRSHGQSEENYAWTGRAFASVFRAPVYGHSATPVEWFDYPYHEGPISIHPQGHIMVITRCGSRQIVYDDYCGLYISSKNASGNWSAPEKMPFTRPGINYMHPAWEADGKALVFAGDDPEGLGGFDLYRVKFDNGNWGEPVNLGRPVNTPGNEVFPWFDQDTLYFSSDHHIGMGGLDIFRTVKQQGGWSPVHNLLPPINSSADDFGFIIRHRHNTGDDLLAEGFFSSSRNGTTDNIFRFEKRKLPPEPKPEEEPIAGEMILDIFVLERVYEDPLDPGSRVLGRRPLEGARLQVNWADSSIAGIMPPADPLSLRLTPGEVYRFSAGKDGYLTADATFDTRSIAFNPADGDQRFELEILLDKIFLDREIVLEDIFYDFDRWDIREDAEPSLRRLAGILERNPHIRRVRLASHTDCRGSAAYNRDLSLRRAQSALEFLVDLGIDRNRLEAAGYGKDRPAVDCICSRCTEEEHQKNRRTTFTILESEIP